MFWSIQNTSQKKKTYFKRNTVSSWKNVPQKKPDLQKGELVFVVMSFLTSPQKFIQRLSRSLSSFLREPPTWGQFQQLLWVICGRHFRQGFPTRSIISAREPPESKSRRPPLPPPWERRKILWESKSYQQTETPTPPPPPLPPPLIWALIKSLDLRKNRCKKDTNDLDVQCHNCHVRGGSNR